MTWINLVAPDRLFEYVDDIGAAFWIADRIRATLGNADHRLCDGPLPLGDAGFLVSARRSELIAEHDQSGPSIDPLS